MNTNDHISRQAAIDYINRSIPNWSQDKETALDCLKNMPSVQPDTSRIENALHGKSAEEQYDFIWWLMRDYGMQFTDTRSAVIEWLRGESNG